MLRWLAEVDGMLTAVWYLKHRLLSGGRELVADSRAPLSLFKLALKFGWVAGQLCQVIGTNP